MTGSTPSSSVPGNQVQDSEVVSKSGASAARSPGNAGSRGGVGNRHHGEQALRQESLTEEEKIL